MLQQLGVELRDGSGYIVLAGGSSEAVVAQAYLSAGPAKETMVPSDADRPGPQEVPIKLSLELMIASINGGDGKITLDWVTTTLTR